MTLLDTEQDVLEDHPSPGLLELSLEVERLVQSAAEDLQETGRFIRLAQRQMNSGEEIEDFLKRVAARHSKAQAAFVTIYDPPSLYGPGLDPTPPRKQRHRQKSRH